MTGKLDARAGTCVMCGGATESGSATLPFVSDERIITIRGVPAEVCGDCGEAYLSGDVVDAVQALVAELRALETEVTVARFRAA